MTSLTSATTTATTQSTGTASDALVVVIQLQPISVIFALPTISIPEGQDTMAKDRCKPSPLARRTKRNSTSGSLIEVNRQADPGSGTVQLKVDFPNPKRHLWPGEFVNVQLVISPEHNGLTIPLDAIQQSSKVGTGDELSLWWARIAKSPYVQSRCASCSRARR